MTALTERTVTIGDTTFEIDQMPSFPAHDLLEEIWDELDLEIDPKLGEQLAGTVAMAAASGGRASDMELLVMPALLEIINKVLKLQAPFKKRLRDKLFAYVRFHNDRAQTKQILAGWETNAFQKTTAVAPTELMIRCLAVNFHGSWEYVAGLLPQVAAEDTPPLPPSD